MYQYKAHINRKVSSCSFHYAEIPRGIWTKSKAFGENLCCRKVKIDMKLVENLYFGGDLPYFALKCDNFPKGLRKKAECRQMLLRNGKFVSIFPSSTENIKMIKGFNVQILRYRRDRVKNRISTLCRNDRLVHVHPRLLVIVKNYNISRVKMKSAIFLQMSYRFE